MLNLCIKSKLKFKKQKCKNTENVAKKILNLPIYPKMKDADIKYVEML